MTKSELYSCAEGGANEDESRPFPRVRRRGRGAHKPPRNATPSARVLREWLQDVGPDGAGVADASDNCLPIAG